LPSKRNAPISIGPKRRTDYQKTQGGMARKARRKTVRTHAKATERTAAEQHGMAMHHFNAIFDKFPYE
jgi:hypothetical protein